MTTRIYVRDMAGYSAAKQAKLSGDGISYVEDAMGDRQRAAWLRSLRPGDVAKVARLSILAAPASKTGPRPSTDFAVTLFRLLKRGVVIVETETGITSDDIEAFAGAVERASNQIASGRRLSPARARKMGEAARRIMIERSAASLIERPEIKRKLPVIRAMWRSGEFTHRDAAADAINAMLREDGLPELGSAMTLFRILGGRGRPKR